MVVLFDFRRQRFIEAIEGIGGGGHEDDSFGRNVIGEKRFQRVTDEDVEVFNILPNELPGSVLRRALQLRSLGVEVDVRAIDDLGFGV